MADAAGRDRGIGGDELRELVGFFGAGDEPKDATRTIEDRVGERHAAAAHVNAGEGDVFVCDFEDRVARDQRGGVTVGAEAEVDEVEHGWRAGDCFQSMGVLSGCGGEVSRFDRHGADEVAREGRERAQAFAEVGQVAIGVAGGGDAFVDLKDADGVPGDIVRCERAEHLPWRMATADSDVE